MNKNYFLSAFFLLLGFNVLFAQSLPTGFSASTIGSGWSEPVGATFSTDGQQLYVWEKNGKVFVCKRNSSGVYMKQTTPVLDISAEVLNWRDHGLLGFALDPNFLNNGFIYLLYVVDRRFLKNDNSIPADGAYSGVGKATIGRITRYKVAGSTNILADVSTRTILLGETPSTGIPILYESHGVGSLVFAADGTLLASTGETASYDVTDPGSIANTYYVQALSDGIIRANENVGAFRAQLLNSHSGKLLRIDPTNGNGVPSNPFYSTSEPRSAKSRVWALGFRNPFRFTIKPGTGSTNPAAGDIGEIYIGDVGYNTYEELNIISTPGANCGWPIFEGLTYQFNYSTLNVQNKDESNPLYGTGGCAQQYFYFRDLLKQATADGQKTVNNPCNTSVPIGTNNRFFHHRPSIDWKHYDDIARVGTFNGNNASEAELGTAAANVIGASFGGNCSVGGVWYTGTLFPASYQNTYFLADYGQNWLKSLSVDFTDVVQKVQNFASGFGAIVCITENPLDQKLVYVDIGNNVVKSISYGGNQFPVAKISTDKIYGPSPLTVNFTGTQSFDPDGASVTYQWNFGDPTSGSANTSTSATPSHTFTFASGSPKKYVVQLTVKDVDNATTTENIIISVNNTPPVVNIITPQNNATYTVGGGDSVINCTANVTDAEHTPAQLTYAWQTFLRHNNHQHPEAIDANVSTTSVISRIGCNGDTYYWHVELTVTDEAGLSTKTSSDIYPNCNSNNYSIVNGSVTLLGRPPVPNARWQVPLQVDFFSSNNNLTPQFTYNITTDQYGNFSIPDIPQGTYTIAVKGAHTLKRVKTAQVLAAGANNISFGILLEGDVNNDNHVDPLDASLLLNSFYKIFGEAGYDLRADLNGDNVVDPLDASLLLNSFYQDGETP